MKISKKRFDTFIEGKDVDLVVLTEHLLENTNWYNWFNDAEINQNTEYHVYPNSLETQRQFFKNNIENSKQKIQLGIFHKNDEVLIGMTSLSQIDYFNSNCEFSSIIGEKKYQAFAYFIEAARLIISHGFYSLGMERIYSGTISEDIHNLICRMLDFKEEGIKRSAVFKNGQFRDAYMHAILKSDFMSSKIYS